MKKIEELLEKDNGLYTSYSVKDKEDVYKKVVSSEKAAEITKDIAIRFAKWIAEEYFTCEDDINWTSELLNYSGCVYNTEQLFKEFLKTL